VIHLVHSVQDGASETLEVSESVWLADRVIIIDDYAIAQAPKGIQGMSDV